jgi:hypothetical protein
VLAFLVVRNISQPGQLQETELYGTTLSTTAPHYRSDKSNVRQSSRGRDRIHRVRGGDAEPVEAYSTDQ